MQLMIFAPISDGSGRVMGDFPCVPSPLLPGPVDPIPSTRCNARYWPCHASDPGLPPSNGHERGHEVWRRAHWLMGECAGERTRGKWRKRKVRK